MEPFRFWAVNPERDFRLMSHMSESAAIIKSFFTPSCATLLKPHTLPVDGAEDKALPGEPERRLLGQDQSGACFELSEPQQKIMNWDWHQQRKIPGVWGVRPRGLNGLVD